MAPLIVSSPVSPGSGDVMLIVCGPAKMANPITSTSALELAAMIASRSEQWATSQTPLTTSSALLTVKAALRAW